MRELMGKRKVVVALLLLVCVALVVAAIYNQHLNNETVWVRTDAPGILTFDKKYEWKQENDFARGECEIYRGADAEVAFADFSKERLRRLSGVSKESMEIEETEHLETKLALAGDGAFLLEMKPKEVVINGKSVEPIDSFCFCQKTTEGDITYLLIRNLWNNEKLKFRLWNKREFEKKRTLYPDGPKYETSTIEDYKVEYSLPKGYILGLRKKSGSLYATSGNKYLRLRVIETEKALGFVSYQKSIYPIIQQGDDGYVCKRQFGPNENWCRIVERDNLTCVADTDDVEILEEFCRTIKKAK